MVVLTTPSWLYPAERGRVEMTTKTVHYRKFEAVNGAWPNQTLHGLLTNALQTVGATGQRRIDDFQARTFLHPNDDDLHWLIHNIIQTDESLFGTLCLFSPEFWAAVLKRTKTENDNETLTDALRQIEIAERPPEDGEDFLRGIAYWLVVKNHFFVVQHVALQTKAFEAYFAQLFNAANLSPTNERFGLTSVFDKAVVGGDLGDVSAVEIGGIVPRASVAAATAAQAGPRGPVVVRVAEEQRGLGSEKVSTFERAKDVLVAVLGSPNAEKILSAVPPEAELEVDVRFGYRTRKRLVSRAALGELAQAARNLPDGEVRAIGRDGKQVGNDLRLSASMPFKPVRERSSLLELDSTREALLRTYQRFVEDGKIDP